MKHLISLKHFLVLMLFVISILFLYQPATFFLNDLKVGSISSKDVISPQTITYVDEVATEELERKALEEVESVYDQNPEVLEELNEKINLFVTSISTFKSEQGNEEIEEEDKMKISDVVNPFSLSKETLRKLADIDLSTITNFTDYAKNELKLIYSSGLTEGQIESTADILLGDSNLYFFPETLRVNVYGSILKDLKPNFVLNEEETEKRKSESLESIEPVYKKVTRGEAIIRKYEEVTETHIEKLEKVGLISQGLNLNDLLKMLPSVFLFSLIFHLYCSKFLSEKMISLRKYSITLILIAITVFTSQLLQNTEWFIIPILTTLIIFSIFWPLSFVIIVAIFLGGLVNYSDITAFILTLIAGLALIIFHNNYKNFTDAVKYGMIIGVILSISSFVFHYAFEQRVIYDGLLELIFSGVFSGIIASGLIPLIEKFIGMATVYKLTELNRYDHPLLEELYNVAKGTYEHSRNVSHLSTVAAKKIGANSLILRVAGLYHDIGKKDNPECFIENSSPEGNIHDKLAPLESAKIILNHPLKSAEICKKHGIPEEVIQLILKHHGDSTLDHFYHKELKNNPDANLEDFRYQTEPPVTKEETILLLADSVEAYSRVLKYNDYETLKQKINEFVRGKIESGVLRKSELSLEEVHICIEEFCKALIASGHKRVNYKTKYN